MPTCAECGAGQTNNIFITTTPAPNVCWVNGKNPCNLGSCSRSSLFSSGYFCVCSPGVTG